jgi:hypothetical protein
MKKKYFTLHAYNSYLWPDYKPFLLLLHISLVAKQYLMSAFLPSTLKHFNFTSNISVIPYIDLTTSSPWDTQNAIKLFLLQIFRTTSNWGRVSFSRGGTSSRQTLPVLACDHYLASTNATGRSCKLTISNAREKIFSLDSK